MKSKKPLVEIEYELRLTKKILEKILELNKDKELISPSNEEMDKIEEELRSDLRLEFPKYKIQKK
ncbi:hypothetical protein [Flagellimonas sp. CMM7]|uniref:hypothetical protein n=1 Tax=Flavobacteriaceae TaxID=49546 RepID=UPI0013D8B08F|nr:hypothetical protein [Flagellimonas sp. CMM7]UII79524.1 hypothetical protein LV704_17920 [Flagellimonas sp. CMM7]